MKAKVTELDRRLWVAMKRARAELREAVERAWRKGGGGSKSYSGPDDEFRTFVERTTRALESAYEEAWALGADKAGGAATGEAAQLAGRIATEQDQPYLLRFAQDLLYNDRYVEGELDWPLARAELYIKRIRGVANESFHAYSPRDLTWEWILGVAEHCEDCPRLASSGPYLWNEMGVFPGDGSTACHANCTCRIVRSDGVEGFLPEDWDEAL